MHLPAHKLTPPTHGYRRSRDVPGSNAKVCKTCDLWFAARPREVVCDGCVPNAVRAKRASLAGHTRTARCVGKRAGRRGVESTFLGVAFKPGVPLWKVLAFEAAQKIDRGYAWPPETLEEAHAADRRVADLRSATRRSTASQAGW